MPLVKQGIFKQYYNKCKEIKKNADDCHDEFFDEYGNYASCSDVFSDYFYEVDFIYCEAVKLKTSLETLLEVSEQKTKKSIKKCNQAIKVLDEVIQSCIGDFRSVYDSFNNDFSFKERETFGNYEIYKEI